jgi:hypothetical protein
MTENLSQKEIQQSNEAKTEQLVPQTEMTTELNGVDNGIERIQVPSTQDDILKSYKDLASAYEVSVDTIRKDLKRITAITEGFVTGLELTRKVGRRVVVTAQGQTELAKYREIGADAYIRELEDIYAANAVDEDELPQDDPTTNSESTGGQLTVRDDRASTSLAQGDQQSAINAQGSQLAQYSQTATAHQENQFNHKLENQEVEGLQDGALLAVQRHAATLEGYHRTLSHLNQSFLSQTSGRAASANLSGLQDFTQQVGNQSSVKKPGKREFLSNLLGKFE